MSQIPAAPTKPNMFEHLPLENWDGVPTPLIPLPELRGTPIDISGMPQLARENPGFIETPLRVVGIRFAETGKVYDFDAGATRLKLNDGVVVEAAEKGLMLGWVAKPPLTIENAQLNLKLPPLLRLAGTEDHEQAKKAASMGVEATMKTQDAVNKHRLPMKVLKVEYTLDLRKSVIYFASEDRVDFRELLRELVHLLRSKVELRQVGARDQSKLTGGIGPCGEELCCSRFIDKFHNVTIKMAKDQDLSLKPTKVTGVCGRLKCCLAYEEQAYVDARREMPRKGKCVSCKSGGCGVVKDVNFLKRTVTVQFDDGGVQVLPASEVVEEKTMNNDFSYKDETVVGSSDDASDLELDESERE